MSAWGQPRHPRRLDALGADQKASKVINLLQAMRRAGLVHKQGARATAIWQAELGNAHLG